MTPENKIIFKWIVKGVIGLVCLMFLWGSFVIVRPGKRGVVILLGAVQERIMPEGLNLKKPFIESVKKLDVKTQKEEVKAEAASKDLQNVAAVIALNYNLMPDKVNVLWKEIGSEYKERIIDPAIQEAVKAVTAKYTAEQLVTRRAEVRDFIRLSLSERLVKEYINVSEVSIVNFDFSQSFNQAIEAKVTAEQNALAAKNKLEQVKFEKEQRIAQAQGEAEAIKIQAQAITQQGGEDYVNLKAVDKWDGKLPTQMIPNATLPFINLNKYLVIISGVT